MSHGRRETVSAETFSLMNPPMRLKLSDETGWTGTGPGRSGLKGS